jgi:hypothetical protein
MRIACLFTLLLVVVFASSCRAVTVLAELVAPEGIAANKNDIETINGELPAILAPKTTQIGDENHTRGFETIVSLKRKTDYNFSYDLKLESETLAKGELEAHSAKLIRYITLRFMGHSKEYASWIVDSKTGNTSQPFFDRYPWIIPVKNEIAIPWVRRLPKESPSFIFQSDVRKQVLIVDADLAWIYAKTSTSDIYRHCMDGAEFSAKLSQVFSTLTLKWKAKVNTGRSKDNLLEKWSFFSENLRNNQKIIWRTPLELNPGLIID